jgi:3'-phosphoadenosine 5'-phosphosulfate sulfotransferase (PAPS reductase)/FAD synthetase
MFSGGVGSWATAKRVAEKYGTDDLVLLFADTKMEDEDLYRFLDEAAANVGGELRKVAEGRDVWQVFRDVKYLGNSRIDPCSNLLKRKFLRKYIDEHFDPSNSIIYLGIDWTESPRFEKAQRYWEPWATMAPLCEPPYIGKESLLSWLREEGIEPPRLYELGFPHNNCGGFCIKAGQAQFKLLLKTMPERFKYHEEKEQEIREYLGKDVTILRKTENGVRRNLTLRELRETVEREEQIDEFDWGGCGCFSPDEYNEDEPVVHQLTMFSSGEIHHDNSQTTTGGIA